VRKLALALAAVTLLAIPGFTQTLQVTKVGICDFMKVLTVAYKDTKAVRDYQQALAEYNKDVAAIQKAIVDLQNQKLDADKAGNKDQSLKLDSQISQQQKYLNDYRTVRSAVLNQQASMLLAGPVLKDIMDVVGQVAEAGGYALVLRSDGAYRNGILYNTPEVDITDDVISAIAPKGTAGQ
jgi:Skp family chaperone for outer membrane proteins